jgi:hypothetical protein
MRLGQYLNVKKMNNGGYVPGQGLTAGGYSQDHCSVGQLNVDGVCTSIGDVVDMQTESTMEDINQGSYDLNNQNLTNVDSIQGSDFSTLAGLAQDPTALATYLTEEYGLQEAGKYTGDFEEYNPYKEQRLQETYKSGLEQAQTGARSQLSDLYSQARQAGGRSGFGGTGKRLSALKGRTLGDLKTKQQTLGSAFTSGVQDVREDYVTDFLNQITKLGQMGATFNPVG